MSFTDTFIDFYEVLQLSPRAELDTIQRVYKMLSQRYHPENPNTGNPEKFGLAYEAYRILSNPTLRSQYDAEYQARQSLRNLGLDPTMVGEAQADRTLRFRVLQVLSARRRADPAVGAVDLGELGEELGVSPDKLEFTLWFLKEKHLLSRTDDSRFAITAAGIEYLEEALEQARREARK